MSYGKASPQSPASLEAGHKPLTCGGPPPSFCRPDYPPGVWQLLRAYVPPAQPGAPPPTCLVAASDRSKADQLAAATGFAAWPLLLGHSGEAGRLSSSANGRCCLEQAAAAAAAADAQLAPPCAAAQAAATAIPPARPLPGADAFCFAGSLHLVDTHAALQVGWGA